MTSTDCRKLWPPSDPQAALLHWSFVAGRLGASAILPRPFLICIRGVGPFEQSTHPLVHAPVYDDCGVLLVRGEHPVVFEMASHSYQSTSRASPDVDGDGLGDTASVRPGRYLLKDLHNGSEVLFHLLNPDGTDRLPVWRDTNHDRAISEEERAKSEAARKGPQVGPQGMWADSVLLHGGLDSEPKDKHKFSIACWTCSPRWRALLSEKCKPHGMADVELVEAERLLELIDDMPRWDDGDSDRPPPGGIA